MASIMWCWINSSVTELLLLSGGGAAVKTPKTVFGTEVLHCSLSPDLLIYYGLGS